MDRHEPNYRLKKKAHYDPEFQPEWAIEKKEYEYEWPKERLTRVHYMDGTWTDIKCEK